MLREGVLDRAFKFQSLSEERELALDLSAEVRRLAADPEFVALLLIAEAEVLELGECFGREFEHFDDD